MRPKTYHRSFCLLSAVPQIENIPFRAEDFKEVGMMMNCAGMPLLEAYWLVNKWNKENGPHGYSYWLEIQ